MPRGDLGATWLWGDLNWGRPDETAAHRAEAGGPPGPGWPAGHQPPTPLSEWPLRRPDSQAEARVGLLQALTAWLNLLPLPLQPYTTAAGVVWGVTLRSGSLAGRLVSELTGSLQAPLYLCDNCGDAYLVPADGMHRGPSGTGRRHRYCPECGSATKWAASKAESQRRRRGEAARSRGATVMSPATPVANPVQ